MSVDVCFWYAGEGSALELYEEAADGVAGRFISNAAVLTFRNELISRWPDIEDSIEPLAYDPDLDEQEDLSRFVLVGLNARRADLLPQFVALAISLGLQGYDPQIEESFS